MEIRRSVGLKEIAAELNISINAVSRALRDCSDISESTKQKVRNAAIELGYVPNAVAQSLRNGKSKQIGFVTDTVLNPFLPVMSDIILNKLEEIDYGGVIIPNKTGFDRSVIAKCISQRLDAIVAFVKPTPDTIECARLNNLKIVFLGKCDEPDVVKCVYLDTIKGGRLAGEHFVKNGHKNLIYVSLNGAVGSKRRQEGIEGFVETFNSRNGEQIKLEIVKFEEMETRVPELIKQGFTGIHTHSDTIGLILEKHLSKLGLKDGVMIIGIDGVGRHLSICEKINSIVGDFNEGGEKVIEKLKLIFNGKADEVGDTIIDVNLILEDQ